MKAQSGETTRVRFLDVPVVSSSLLVGFGFWWVLLWPCLLFQ